MQKKVSFVSNKFVTTGLVTMFLAVHAVDAAGEAMKKTTWAPACHLARELRKSPAKAAAKLSAIGAATDALKKAGLRLQLYAKRLDLGDKLISVTALAQATLTAAERNEKAYRHLTTKAIQTAATTQELVGGIEATMQLFKSTKGTSAYCLGDGDSQADKTTDLQKEGCEGKPADLTTDPGEYDSKVISSSGFAELSQISGSTGMDSSDTNKCGLVNHGAAGTAAFLSSSTVSLGYELFKLSASNQIHRDSHQTLSGTLDRQSDKLTKIAYQDAKEMETAEAAITESNEEKAVTEVSTDGTVSKRLKDLLKLKQPTISDTDLTKKVDELQTQHYGKTGENIKQLWSELKVQKVRDVKAKTETEQDIGIIPDEETLRLTLAFYDHRSQTQLQELTEKTTVAKAVCEETEKTEETCNAIEEQEKCDNTPRCHYNKTKEGKKCTLSEEAKKTVQKEAANQETGGKDGKTKDKCTKHRTDKTKCDEDNSCKWDEKVPLLQFHHQ
uniref:Variant surface glycoprotein 1125.1044 n=1 Tax=Trypanosoma brucei TaxID=5691 RepID=A0A1J0R643_9TRYP|nr:variant surface glycoprotein 1125.1044 [Trypanosoma brucei]